MKDGFRQSMAWLHTWSGLVVGWVLFFVFVTGSAGYFTYEITRWMEPERALQVGHTQYDNRVLAELALNRLVQVAPNAEFWSITLPHHSQSTRSWQGFAINWETIPLEGQAHGVHGNEDLEPGTGRLAAEVSVRQTGGGDLLYRMHYALHYLDYELAYRIVGICTMLMLLAILTGVIAHKKIFKDFFTFRPSKGQRSWLDAHNVTSVMALPFFLMITYSGFLFFYTEYMPAGMAVLYGTDEQAQERFFDELYGEHAHSPVIRPEASVAQMIAQAEEAWGPGQVRSVFVMHDSGEAPVVEVDRVIDGRMRTFDGESLRFNAQTGKPLPAEADTVLTIQAYDTLLALHEGRFAEIWLRWLYFFSGLLGCAMIATGLVLWTVKRRKQYEKTGLPLAHRVIEALNVATIAGLSAGVAGYFWANRLLPVDMLERANWEANFIFLIWGEAFIYALFRDTCKAWVELLWFAAAAYALLPALNYLTTDKHLAVTLVSGDWVLAGFDLTMLALGFCFAYMAVKVKRSWLKSTASVGKSTAFLRVEEER